MVFFLLLLIVIRYHNFIFPVKIVNFFYKESLIILRKKRRGLMKNSVIKQAFKSYNRVVFFIALIPVLIILSCLTYAKGAVEPAQSPKQSQDSIDISDIKRIEGIAWDGKNLLAFDGEKKRINRIDTISRSLVQPLDLNQKKLKGLAFDEKAKAFWVADEEEKTLIMIDPVDGRTIKTINMEIPADKGFDSIEGIAWGGGYLWVAIDAGFSSSFNQIDPETGKIVRSIFADCFPRGIATDGEYLWSICYNGEKFPSKIDKRKIQATKDAETFHSRVFIKDITNAEPAGLVFDGKHLWYADRLSKSVIKVTKPYIPDVKGK